MIERSEQGRMRLTARGRWIAGLLAAAIVIGLLAAWLSRGEFKGKYAIPELGADKTAAAPQAPVAAPPAAPRAAPPPVATQPAAPPPLANDDDYGLPATIDEDDDGARMARAIERAARKALDRGEPVRWHKAGERGYVVVSEPRAFPDRVCRNVSATINREDGPAQSSSHLWCRGYDDDADWQPAE